MATNKEIYETSETGWGTNQNDGLINCEKYLIEKYLTEKDAQILEGGCGGGRVSFNLLARGYSHITGYDFNEAFIANAKAMNKKIDFFVEDASNLKAFPDKYAKYILNLQQLFCFLPDELVDKALDESYRVLKDDGIICFSVLYFHGRKLNYAVAPLIKLLNILRGKQHDIHSLPWMKLKRKPNWRFMGSNQAYVYWYGKGQFEKLLESHNYHIIEKFFDEGKTIQYIVCSK